MKKLWMFLLTLMVFSSLWAWNSFHLAKKMPSEFRIVFYNVENFFHPDNDPNKQDDDFTTFGKLNWDTIRYQKKLENIAKVLNSIQENKIIPFIGLCEIENRKVLEDLLTLPEMNNKNYAILHKDSPDERGIDVAMLYRESSFRPMATEWLTINLPGPKIDSTRDILYVKGKLMSDTIHVFINHWPSRKEGKDLSEPKRIAASALLVNRINDINIQNPNAKIIVMGDFNDEPTNKSISTILNARYTINSAIKNNWLYNMMYEPFRAGIGSYYYQGSFDLFDQIIVSNDLLESESKGIVCRSKQGSIYFPDWLCFIDSKSGDKKPNRTYAGTKYYGGFSDHFPVYIDLKMNW